MDGYDVPALRVVMVNAIMSRFTRFAVVVLVVACSSPTSQLPTATLPPATTLIFDDDFSVMTQPQHWAVAEDEIFRSG